MAAEPPGPRGSRCQGGYSTGTNTSRVQTHPLAQIYTNGLNMRIQAGLPSLLATNLLFVWFFLNNKQSNRKWINLHIQSKKYKFANIKIWKLVIRDYSLMGT